MNNVENFEWIEVTSIYNEESDKGYFLKSDIQYTEKLHERFTIFTKKNGNWKNREACSSNLHETTEYVIYIRNSK